MTLTLCASLGLSLVTSFLMMPISRFKATKWHGVVLVALYLGLLAAAITVEFTLELTLWSWSGGSNNEEGAVT